MLLFLAQHPIRCDCWLQKDFVCRKMYSVDSIRKQRWSLHRGKRKKKKRGNDGRASLSSCQEAAPIKSN